MSSQFPDIFLRATTVTMQNFPTYNKTKEVVCVDYQNLKYCQSYTKLLQGLRTEFAVPQHFPLSRSGNNEVLTCNKTKEVVGVSTRT